LGPSAVGGRGASHLAQHQLRAPGAEAPGLHREWRSRLSWPERSRRQPRRTGGGRLGTARTRPAADAQSTQNCDLWSGGVRTCPDIPLAVLLLFWPRRRGRLQPAAAPELRALWVDAFHAASARLRRPRNSWRMRSGHTSNTLIRSGPPARRRALRGRPRAALDDPSYSASFDALAHIRVGGRKPGRGTARYYAVDQCHARVARRGAPEGRAPGCSTCMGIGGWRRLLVDEGARDGTKKFPVGYFLDPGHPAAQNHLVSVYSTSSGATAWTGFTSTTSGTRRQRDRRCRAERMSVQPGERGAVPARDRTRRRAGAR